MPPENIHPSTGPEREPDAGPETAPDAAGETAETPEAAAMRRIREAEDMMAEQQRVVERASSFERTAAAERKDAPDLYGQIYENTAELLNAKIERAKLLLTEEQKDVNEVTWGERFDSTFKFGGLLGTTRREAEEEGMTKQRAVVKTLENLAAEFNRTFTKQDTSGLNDLKAFRMRMGWPEIPSDLVADYDAFVASVDSAAAARMDGLEVNWQEINDKLRSSEKVLNGWETALQTIDTGMGVVAGFVPGGSEVYELSRALTSVAIGTKSPAEAAYEFAFGVIAGKVGGKAVAKMKVGDMATEWAKKVGEMATEWAEKNAALFTKEMANKAAQVFGSTAEGAVRGSVTGGTDSALNASVDVARGKETLEGAAERVVRDAAIGTAVGGVAGGAIKTVELRRSAGTPEASGVRTLDPAQKKTVMELPDTPAGLEERVRTAGMLLDLPDMNDVMKKAIIDAHNVPMSNGSAYTMGELAQKMRILEQGGFTRDQADVLLRNGVCGAPPPVPGRTVGAVPPPPPPRPASAPPPMPPARPASAPAAAPGMRPPPPPPVPRARQTPLESAGRMQAVNDAERKDYFREMAKKPLWLQSLRNAERVSAVYGSGNERNHVLWIKNGGDTSMRGLPKGSVTERYISSPEGTPEHALFKEAEQLLMQAFKDGKRLLGRRADAFKGIVVTNLGESAGMVTGNTLGFHVNSSNTDELLKALALAKQTGDYSGVRREVEWLRSACAHEMTHNIRGKMDDKPRLNANEVPSHAVQFLTAWDGDTQFFSRRIGDLRSRPPEAFERIHAELGGLQLLQQKLTAAAEASYKPANYSPEELQRSIRSIPENIRTRVLTEMTAEILETPVQDFERNVREVFDRSRL